MTAPTYISSGGSFEGTGNLTPTPPSGAINDTLILTVHGDENGTLTTPTGWTALASSPQTTGAVQTSTGNTLWVFWRKATGTLTTDDSAGTFDTGTHTVTRIHRFRGCPTSVSPILVEAGSIETTTLTTPQVVPDLVITSPDTVVVIVAGHGANTTNANYATGTSTFDSDFTATPTKIDDGSNNLNGAGSAGGAASWFGTVLNPTTITGASLDMVNSSAKTNIVFALAPATVSPSSTDTGLGTQAHTIAQNLTDTSSGSEATPSIGISGTDTSSSVEATSSIGSNRSDVASGAETATIAIFGIDTSSSAETLQVAPTVSDTGASTETLSLTAQIPGTDLNTAIESSLISATLSDSDTGTDTESENAAEEGTAKADSDTATASETARITTGWSDPEDGSTGDTFLLDTDTGTGSESHSIAATRPSTDTGTSSETHDLAVTSSSSDIGHGTDFGFVGLFINSSDGATTTETVVSRPATLSSSDLAAASDSHGDDFTAIVATLPLQTDSSSSTQVGSIDTDIESVTPTGLIVSTISDSEIRLSWNASAHAQYYQVERDSVIIASNVVGTTYQDTGLSPNTMYTYRVRAVRVIV